MTSRNIVLACCVGYAAWAASASPTADVKRFSEMYFARMDAPQYWRMYDGAGAVVEFLQKLPGMPLIGAAGWTATSDREAVRVRAPTGDGADAVVYCFTNGVPAYLEHGGVRQEAVRGSRVIPGKVPPLWDEDIRDGERVLEARWKNRLSIFYRNPNCESVLFGSVALLGLWLFLYGRRRKTIFIGLLLGCAAGVCSFLTMSRGGLAGLALGGVILSLFGWIRHVARLRLFALVGAAVVIITCFILGGGITKYRMKAACHESARIETLSAAPQMMVDAPGGWGALMSSGSAYMNWYQPLDKGTVTWTLISGHLTRLVQFGWIGRFLWIFGWLTSFLCFCQFARKGGSPLPAASTILMFTADLFNPVNLRYGLWIMPLAASCLFWLDRPWADWRRYRAALLISCVFAFAAIGTIVYLGQTNRTSALRVKLDGKRVLVNGNHPDRWVVDDGNVLGWRRTGKEIRNFYRGMPGAPALGYVRDFDELPKRVGTLMVAGEQCREFVRRWKLGQVPAFNRVILLSPPFGPSALPAALARSSNCYLIVGEFAARYVQVYGDLSGNEQVLIVPGAEIYIPGWVSIIALQ